MNGFWNRCGNYRKNLSLQAAGLLPEAELARLASHLAGCAGCRAVHAGMKQVTGSLAGWEENLGQLQPGWAARRRWTQAVLASAPARHRPQTLPAGTFVAWLHDLFWPYRHAWAGMAAIWVALLLVNYGNAPSPAANLTASIKPTPETYLALAEQRQLLAELIPPPPTYQPADKPRHDTRPRSQRQTGIVAC